MSPSQPISFIWNPAFLESKPLSWLVFCCCDKTHWQKATPGRKEFILAHDPRLQTTNTGKSEQRGLHIWLQSIHSLEQREIHACKHGCLLVLSPVSLVIQFKSPCLGNGAACGRLCLPTPINLIKTTTFRHTYKLTQCRQSLGETLFPIDPRLYHIHN